MGPAGRRADGWRIPQAGYWRADERLADAHTVEIRPHAPPGSSEVLTGMYDASTLRRLPVTDGAGGPADHIVLGRITVQGP